MRKKMMSEREPYSNPMTSEEIERFQWQEDYDEMYRKLREQFSQKRKRRILGYVYTTKTL
jgi:hypothetical protein|tara:strand:- start:105 stop:284 length:180 start_codon:yes stop_codon:yes gene_type:complete